MTEKRNIAQNLAEDEVLQWVTFQLENETYGINVMQVQEVLRYTGSPQSRGTGLRAGHHQPAWQRGDRHRYPLPFRPAGR